MNFHELMSKARQNQETKQDQTVKRYNTAIPPPKKDAKPKGMSPNVRAFLAKKEQEAKQKVVDQKQARKKYLEKSKQCYRKVQNIHQLIKEDNEKEDEDVEPTSDRSASEANSAFTDSSISTKSSHQFTDGSNSSKSSHQSSKPSHSSSKSESSKSFIDNDKDSKNKSGLSTSKTKPAPKKKGNAPSFSELIKLATEKNSKTSSGKSSNSRLLTEKERAEEERQKAYRKTKEYRILQEYGPMALERYKQQQKAKEEKLEAEEDESDDVKIKQSTTNTTGAKIPSNAAKRPADTKSTISAPSSNKIPKVSKNGTVNPGAPRSGAQQGAQQSGAGAKRPAPAPSIKKDSPRSDENEHVMKCGPAREESGSSAWEKIYRRAHQRQAAPGPPSRGMVIESDESEDEYEEDFIDDGPLVNNPYGNDVSSHIRAIFGYDKRKYRNDDDDDVDNMESSFCQQMKEEKYSAKMGLKEDLDDIKQEEEDMKRKMALKKKMKR